MFRPHECLQYNQGSEPHRFTCGRLAMTHPFAPRRSHTELEKEIDFFGLKENPFSLSPDPRFMYLSFQHTKALKRAKRNIDDKQGLTVLLGDVGVGKSTVARRLFGMYTDDPELAPIHTIRYITNPSHWTTPHKMLATICEEFAIAPRRSETKQWQEFQAHMARLFERGITVVLLLDEAQLIPRRQLQRVREILNFESNSSKFIQIVLFGTLEMGATLAEPDFKALRSRAAGGVITLNPLDEPEMIDALQFRIKVAGESHPELLFQPDCFGMIAKASNGIIRQAVDYCRMAMYLAYTAGSKTITPTIVESTIESVLRLTVE